MTTIFHRGRSRVAFLAVLAMVASLLAIPLSAAGQTTACPSTIPSAGFTDIGAFDQETQDAINCIAFHDVSKGTTATTYGPNDDVSRWQMALFLTRKLSTAGVTLPSGVSQGFTDIGTLDAETQTAINQLAQLNVTKGTTATTFDPTGIVSRWQMALFITRQLTAAGVALPSGASQGFTDIGTLNAETQAAINQLAQLGIAKGTSATTYGPLGNVNRWQMALFLSRDLETLGVVPTGLSGVTVSPTDKASLAAGAARAYTATFTQSGSLYSGFVGIQLLDADANDDPVYNTGAINVTFESGSDGVAAGTTEFNGFAGTDGKVTFVVRHAGAASDVVPVAWIDLDGDSGYESTGNKAPTEPFGLGGETDFAGAAAAEAGDGTYAGMVVSSVDKTGDDFEASATGVNCTNGVGLACQFDYDSNDIFRVKGAVTTLAGFEAALSKTDVVDIVYEDAVADVSSFNITTDNTAVASLKVTNPSKATSIDSNNFLVTGSGEPGYTIAVHNDANNDANTTGESKVAEGTISPSGSWSLSVPLQQNAANDFVATQRKTAATAVPGPGTDVPTITEGAPVAAKLTKSVFGASAPAGLSTGDTITLTFNEKIAGVGSGDSLGIVDQDGSIATIVLGTDTTFALSVGDTVLTLTIVNAPFATGGTTAGILGATQITSITGFQGDDGLAINLAGSGGGRVFTVS